MAHYLLTGGAGYIGSHTAVQLLDGGHAVTVFDNLDTGSRAALARVAHLCGRAPHFVHGDIRDPAALDALFANAAFDAVVHFAGLKVMAESVTEPLRYHETNVAGTVQLLLAMERHGVRSIVFSSTAAVYGDPQRLPVTEDLPLAPANPYARSKLAAEDILGDLYRADRRWRIARLRYFNPVGAHASGLIGEDPSGTPTNLMPLVAQVAAGQRECLSIYGGDWPTRDGSGVRDFIHVVDLADGHAAALRWLAGQDGGALLTVNLGTGRGVSVLELVRAFEAASGRPVPVALAARRTGDVAACWADATLARDVLGWQAARGVEAMCADTWRWQQRNPAGYPAG